MNLIISAGTLTYILGFVLTFRNTARTQLEYYEQDNNGRVDDNDRTAAKQLGVIFAIIWPLFWVLITLSYIYDFFVSYLSWLGKKGSKLLDFILGDFRTPTERARAKDQCKQAEKRAEFGVKELARRHNLPYPED